MINKLRLLEEDISRKIFRYEGGALLNTIAYLFSLVFMEEFAPVTIISTHFLYSKNLKTTAQYLVCFIANLIMTLLVKTLLWRKRPGDDEIPKKTTKTLFFRNKQGNGSFPSGDTIQAWCLATFVYLKLGCGGIFYALTPLAIMIPFSRIYLFCHYISDCVFGALIAFLTTYVVFNFLVSFGAANQLIDRVVLFVTGKLRMYLSEGVVKHLL